MTTTSARLRKTLGLLLISVVLGASPAMAQCLDYDDPLTDPTIPYISLSPDGEINDFHLVGDIAWAARSIYGALVAIDYSDPALPVVLGSEPVDVMNETYDVDVAGDLAFMTYLNWGGQTGVRIFDISDPTDPVDVGNLPAPTGWGWRLAADGDLLYVSFAYYTFAVVDVGTPSAPEVIGQLTVDHPGSITVLGDHVLIANEGTAPLIVDVTEPTTPVIVDTLTTSGGGSDVSVVGDLAYVTADNAFDIVDISNLGDTVLLSSTPLPPPAYYGTVSVTGNLAYVACKDNGVQIFDVQDPAAPVLLGAVDVPGYPYSARQLGDLLLINSNGLLHAAPAQCQPTTTAVGSIPRSADLALSNQPNPFNPLTILSFELPAAATTTLRVHDAAGRLVRTLINGESLPEGPHQRLWEGRDDQGREAPSGVYYARITAGELREVRVLTLVR